MSSSQLCVVLLCSGRGADASSYRPFKDESQWWNRRDALTRCVAALLHGPAVNVELVFLFDQDWSSIKMKLHAQQEQAVPTEQQVVSEWKAAVQAACSRHHSNANNGSQLMGSLFSRRDNHGMDCQVILDKHGNNNIASQQQPSARSIYQLENKRQILQHLQSNCSFEFLKSHRLNSKPNVILRKTNKQKLLDIYQEWTKQQQKQDSTSKKEIGKQDMKKLESIFSELVQPKSPPTQKVIAAYLHESCDSELPCFHLPDNNATGESLQICLFLGAVRDMTKTEHAALQAACSSQNIPLVGVRLGPVPEFTSKILSVVSYHHSHNVLGRALQQLVERSDVTTLPPAPETNRQKQQQQHLHVMCAVPLSSTDLSCRLQDRNRCMWACVRVTVCTLWRSRVISNSNSVLQNTLTLLFQDGVTVTLHQDDFLQSLAEQHQAAPCESQILGALCQQVKEKGSANKGDDAVDWNRVARGLVQSSIGVQTTTANARIHAINAVSSNDDDSLSELLYHKVIAKTNNSSPANSLVLILQSIRPEPQPTTRMPEAQEALVAACQESSVPMVRQSIIKPCQDWEAATITVLQHFIYQGRLVACLEELASSSATTTTSLDTTVHHKERAKKKKKEKKHKKRKRVD